MKKLTVQGTVQGYRDIKITSKRQLTIPKSFFEALNIDETVQAYLLEDGIYLKPVHSSATVYETDIQSIIRKVLEEGFKGDELAAEIAHRIALYDNLMDRRIQEFVSDLSSVSEEEEGEVDYHGLDQFFEQEDGEAAGKD